MALWWVRSDACGLFSALFTVFLILFASAIVNIVLLHPWFGVSIHTFAFNTLCMLGLAAHTKAQFTDPGTVPRKPQPAPTEATELVDANGNIKPRVVHCKRCKQMKPYRSHHCKHCGHCIIRMDHHCPWVNNCVAIFNQKYFIQFLLYIGAASVYAAVLCVTRFISCTQNIRVCTISGAQAVFCALVFIEALIFGLFTTIMMFDQLSAIFENTPGIDALQNRHGPKKGKYESLKDVFGEGFSWRWFFPTSIPDRLRKEWEEAIHTEVIDEAINYAQPHYGQNGHGHAHAQPHAVPPAHVATNPELVPLTAVQSPIAANAYKTS